MSRDCKNGARYVFLPSIAIHICSSSYNVMYVFFPERLLENLNLKRSKITADAGTAQDRKFWEKVVDNLSQNRRDRSRIDTEQRELLGLIEDCD